MIRTLYLVVVVLSLLLVGCLQPPASRLAHLDDSVRFTESPRYNPIEPPRDGKILVFVSGDVRRTGPHWISDDADILTAEAVAGAGNAGMITVEPKLVVIRREVDGRVVELRYDLLRRTRLEKQTIHLKHGDSIIFPWTNCW